MHLQNAFRSHTDSTHVSVEQINSLHVVFLVGLGENPVQSQTLRKTWTCGMMQVFASMTPHLHCKRHDKTTRRDIIVNKKEKEINTAVLYTLDILCMQCTQHVCSVAPASSQC